MSRVLLLRTCKSDGRSHVGFVWPLEVGAEVKPDAWDPEPRCGNGLHGLRNGCGDGTLLDWTDAAVWMVVSAEPADVVDIGPEKAKARFVRVECVGNRKAATDYLLSHGCAGMPVVGAFVTAGDGGSATAGYRGSATAGDRGTLSIRWWDGQRFRIAIGYVGENGIKAGAAYRLTDAGEFVEVKP